MKKNIFIIALIAASIAPLKAQIYTKNNRNSYTTINTSHSSTAFQKSPKSALSKSTIVDNPPAQTNNSAQNAGDHLIKAGRYMTYASVGTAVSTILLYAGEPVSGLLISVAAVVLEFSAYNQLQKAGTELKK